MYYGIVQVVNLQLFLLHYVCLPLIHTSHKELSAHTNNLSMRCLVLFDYYYYYYYYYLAAVVLLFVGFNMQENI